MQLFYYSFTTVCAWLPRTASNSMLVFTRKIISMLNRNFIINIFGVKQETKLLPFQGGFIFCVPSICLTSAPWHIHYFLYSINVRVLGMISCCTKSNLHKNRNMLLGFLFDNYMYVLLLWNYCVFKKLDALIIFFI